MKNIINRFRWVGILLGILLIIGGIIIIALSIYDLAEKKDLATNVLAITTASICFILGATFITSGLMTPLSTFFDPSYVFGAIAIAAGVVLLVLIGNNTTKEMIPLIIVYLLSIALITFGVIYLVRGIMSIVNKIAVIKIVLCFAIATLGIAAGIVSIILHKDILLVIYIILGALIIAAGTIELIALLKKK